MHHVIIGNGGAGTSALRVIRETDPKARITIISREKYPAYSPCSLPNLLSGELDKPGIMRFDRNFYRRHDSEFLKNSEALKIVPAKKQVKLDGGKTLTYDRLLISAGATPITPPMKGLDLKGVHIMGTLDSALGIMAHADKGAKRIVVVGGGFMGIETATMLRKRGLEVTIVELLPRVLARMLDPDVSRRVEKILRAHKIRLILGDAVKSIDGGGGRGGGGDGKVAGVTLGKKKLKCDMVIVAIGVAPNTGLVKGSGIRTGRGILVDTTMRTSRKDVYAAGDIVEVREKVGKKLGSYAIWPNAIDQGRVAGLNMAGVETGYEGAEVVNILDLFDSFVVAIGDTTGALGAGVTEVKRSTPYYYKKLIMLDDRIVGLQFINSVQNTGALYSFMKEGKDVGAMKKEILGDTFVNAPFDTLV